MTPQQFAAAIARIESNDNPQAWGDAGRAMGRYQVHPDWVWTWAHAQTIKPAPGCTWDEFVALLVQGFFAWHADDNSEVEIAMRFHVGHKVQPGEPDWDVHYAERFIAAAQIV